MPFGKGRRKRWMVLGLVVAVLATIWLACPLWFPWVLKPLASRAGVRFGACQRVGYSRFALSDLVLTNESFAVRAQRVVAFIPTVWLWHLATGQANAAEPFAVITNWDCRLIPNNQPGSPPYTQVRDVAAVLSTVEKWLPRAILSHGEVQSGDVKLSIADAVWLRGSVEGRVDLLAGKTKENLTVKLSQATPFELRINLPARGVESTFAVDTNQSGLDIHNSTDWQSNRLELQAHFDPKDDLPRTASAQIRALRLPGDIVKLPGYREISGSLSGTWQDARFLVSVAAAAQPANVQTDLPPLKVDLRVQGDPNSATIQSLEVRSPFLNAVLSNQVRLSFSAPYLQGPATLSLTVDLAQQHWVPLKGKLTGEADVTSSQGAFPHAQLRLTGAQLGNEALLAEKVNLAAKLDWPILEFTGVDLRFDDASRATLSGKMDLEQQTAFGGRAVFNGPLVQRWLPAGYSYNELAVSGSFEGPIKKLAHQGHLVAQGIQAPGFRPCALDLQWTGQATSFQRFELQVEETNASISAVGALTAAPEQIRLRLDSLNLKTNRSNALALSEPVTVSFTPSHGSNHWQLASGPVRLTGPGGELSVQTAIQWPDQGNLDCSLQRFGSDLLDDFIKTAPPFLQIKSLAASLQWTNGPASLSLEASGTGLAQPRGAGAQKERLRAVTSQDAASQMLSTPLNFELVVRGDQHGLVLSNLVVNTATSSVVAAHGLLPLTFNPASSTNLINLSFQQNITFNATVRPQAFFWEHLAELTGVRLDQPLLDLNLAGTWRAPQGNINFRARGIELMKTNAPKIKLEDLRLSVSLNREKAQLTEGRLLVQGQEVVLSGEMPLGENAWTGLLHKEVPSWQKVTGRLLVQNAELAAFEPIFPELLAPQGNLNLDVQLLPDLRLEGLLALRRARTRPLGNTAPLRDINVTLRFHNRTLKLEDASASLSGAQVNMTGSVDLSGTNWMNGDLPPFNIVLRGTNVPLAREPEYIIRSDLDLAVSKTNNAPPFVSGTARLRDSFFLSDLSALVPNGAATVSSRPPYFSIDNPTLAGWRLGVSVEGVRWLKVRTTLFNGEVSANLHLEGSLKEPIALGVVKIDSGIVRFPFANLQVQQGLVTLTSENPYHPQLLVRAASKQFGYDIRLEVSGSVDLPVIQFTSNPSLSSEQILLMISAGQLPAGSFTLTPQQRAQTVALFLGRDVLAKLGFGDQSQERLTISSGEEISQQGKPTYHIEYKLTKRWSVEGEYDRFGDFNAGLKWRIYSK